MTFSPDDKSELESAYLLHPVLSSKVQQRDLSSILEELDGLARAIELEVVGAKTVKVNRIQAGSFLGKGQRQDIADDVEQLEPGIVIVNHALSPVQQRNLEREWGTKVIDRTGLILEIFGARAQTKEGRIQVELAALEYQKSRLVRSWTHLERQRGGAGFMGGPGERQIELDRRMIDQRIGNLKKDLEHVRRTRDLGRQSRARIPLPIVALVGYTNAGKSTLFNTLTKSDVFAEDLPFATLDPTLRRLGLANGQQVILSDTVGFISELPTHLIAAFRATLEQVAQADVIVHVIDASKGDYTAQRQDVIEILKDLEIDYENDGRIIEVYNKIDRVLESDRHNFERKAHFSDHIALISALKNQGLDNFLDLCAHIIGKNRLNTSFAIDITDGKALSWLYQHCEVLSRKDHEDHIDIHVMIEPAVLAQFKNQYNYQESSAA